MVLHAYGHMQYALHAPACISCTVHTLAYSCIFLHTPCTVHTLTHTPACPCTLLHTSVLFQHYIGPWLLSKVEGNEPTFKESLQKSLENLSVSMASIEAVLVAQKDILEDLVSQTNSLEANNTWKNESNDIKSEIISLKGLLLSS